MIECSFPLVHEAAPVALLWRCRFDGREDGEEEVSQSRR